MTAENNNIIYKIVVTGIESYTQELPATITSNFVLDEIVTGATSGASAVVDKATLLTDDAIRIRSKSGFFIENEELTGSVTGAATKISNTEVVNAPYENTDFDIVNGTWTLLSDGDILTKMSDPVEKINISKGGNLASGYSFGFEVTNFEFAKALQQDGVFFRNRKCVLSMGIVDGGIVYTDQWTGVIESFTDVNEETVSFKCSDLTKQNVTNVGSELVPIALNRNYNCKLAKSNEEIIKTSYVNKVTNGFNVYDNYVYEIDQTTNKIVIIGGDNGNYDTGALDNFDNGYIEVTMGDGAGALFKIYKAEERFENDKFDFWVNEDTGSLKALIGADSNNNISIVRVVSYSNKYNLSSKDVLLIHNELGSNIKKPLTIYDNELEFGILWPDNYIPSIATDGTLQVDTKAIDSSSNMELFSKIPLSIASDDYSIADATLNLKNIKSNYYISKDQLLLIDEQSEKGNDVFFDFGEIKLENFFSAPPTSAFLLAVDYRIKGYYDSNILQNATVDIMISSADDFNFASMVEVSGNDLIISYTEDFLRNFDAYELSNYSNSSVLSEFQIELFVTVSSDTAQDPTDYIVSEFGFRYGGNLSTDEMSIGCNGENVQSAQGIIDGFETVPDTIEYLLTDHYDKELTDIDLTSFSEAQDNFTLFINDPVRNAAHQIVSQTDANQLLKDILFDHHLGMFINHSGEYHLENWLPKSIVFGFKTADTAYDETNTLSIKPIKRDTLNNVVSDYQLKMDLSEATGEHNRTLRVKNPNESTFDFARDIEGVDASDEALAFSAWQLAKAGYNRVTNLTQTEQESNWHKLAFSDGTGTSESIAFIRNQLAHVNREHEYITFTVPYNTTNLSKELLSFISIEDAKITDGEARNGWIVERRLNLKNDTITWKLLLDISKYDPFLFQVNVWKDGNFVLNIKKDGNFPDNTKSNGTGT